MKKYILTLGMAAMAVTVFSQKYFTRAAEVDFVSEAPLEKIEAQNTQATSVIDVASEKIECAVLIKAFKFEKALMEEHFNENYMESSKYPKATLKGQIAGIEKVDFKKDGNYEVQVEGTMDMHGEQQPVSFPAVIEVKGKKVTGTADFEVALADYKIEIPAVVAENISETVAIHVHANYEELNR